MAEITEKKPRAPRKPKASKEIVSKNEVLKEEITPKEITPKGETLEEETSKLDAVVAVLSPENPQDLEPVQPILRPENPQSLDPIQTEVASVEEIVEKIENLKEELPKVELGVSTPEEAFNEITETLANNQTPKAEQVETSKLKKGELKLQLKKLNPNLEDGKSKWSFQVIKDHLTHEIFRGSLLRAHKWAENYCLKHNLDVKSLQKIRK